ncbi:DUF732 domain-containing protein [Mycolicibacterium sp.]|uniref:DUF732 domain-containing protein n=1 Tax=Mycolicibacterium sp. TaxID=2320850 RepID=UPI001A2EF3DA|nr:DUF732 domain-containing protein [Mycolicibacterium sp.]MBJ7340688.1 DUF732 domain-containing protein [Mycolicibacterium sp.]
MKTVLAVILGVGVAIGVAPSAAAAEADYLNQLQPRLAYLSSEQLLSEGYKVCRFIGVGRPSADAIPVVMKDLNVTVAAAMAIIPAAVTQLDC